MNLGKNIYNLLKRQTDVYVQGLGSFTRNHTPATFDEKRNAYLPPISYIDFDRSSTIGYDFVHYLQQLHLVERSEAQQQVADAVSVLLQKIAEDGQAKLDDLGYLVSYGDGYVFKALDLSGFNYKPVVAPANMPISPTTSEDSVPVEEKTMNVAPQEEIPVAMDVEQESSHSGFSESEAQQPVAAEFVEDDLEEETWEPESGRNVIWYIVSAIIAVGILVALYFANRGNPTAEPVERVILADSLSSSNVNQRDTTGSGLTDSLVQADSLSKQPVDSIAKKEVNELIPANHTWQIVIGSHRTLAQAYEQAESYNKAGYPRVRVIPSNLAKNRKKVIWDWYETKAKADSALQYVQKHIIKDAWPDKIN